MSTTELPPAEWRLFDIKTAASLLSLSPWTVRKLIKAGKLRPVRLGRRVLLEPVELQRFVDEAKAEKRT